MNPYFIETDGVVQLPAEKEHTENILKKASLYKYIEDDNPHLPPIMYGFQWNHYYF